MNDFIYVPVEVEKELPPVSDEIFVGIKSNGHPESWKRKTPEDDEYLKILNVYDIVIWLKKVPVSEYLKSISPIIPGELDHIINKTT